MSKIWRAVAVIIVIYVLVMALLTVQYFFDRGDMKKAAHVIYQFKPDKHRDEFLIDLIARTLQVTMAEVHCETQIISRFAGSVFVECGVNKGFTENNAVNTQWVVDVVNGRVVAKNDKARKLMHREDK